MVVIGSGRWAGWLGRGGRELTAVAVVPDLGERYLDTIYQTNWFSALHGEDVLGPGLFPATTVMS
jgi:N-(2-amino-2-carboxyethyl)-L-glutamate synthase